MERSQVFQYVRRISDGAAALCLLAVVVLSGCSGSSQQGKPPAKRGEDDQKNSSSTKPPSTARATDVPAADDGTGKTNVQADRSTATIDPPPDGRRVDAALFEGWKKPQVALLITGLQQGYLEPCGCTGLDNQKGGLMRRHTLLQQLSEGRQWNVVAVDLGGMVRRSGRQAVIKYQRTIDILKFMNYRAIGFGPKDLRLNTDELFATAAQFDTSTTPFVSANVRFYDLEDDTMPAFRLIDAGGIKIGVTSLLGKSAQQQIRGDDILFRPAIEALGDVTANLVKANCDLLVLLAHASMKETKEYAEKFPQYDVVVTAGGATEPPRMVERLGNDGRVLVEVGHKVLYTPVLGVYDAKGNDRLRYELVPLDSRLKDSKPVAEKFAQYQEQLESLWKNGFDALGIRPMAHASGRKFVGSSACQDCHSTAYDIWNESRHAHATETLVHPPERTLTRVFDPECVSCHSTGWEPQRFQPYESGFVDVKTTPLLTGTGCENCHGPGDQHVAAENGDIEADDNMLEQLRTEMRLPLAQAQRRCITCHDLDNSPDFHKEGSFEKYWEKVKHIGKD